MAILTPLGCDQRSIRYDDALQDTRQRGLPLEPDRILDHNPRNAANISLDQVHYSLRSKCMEIRSE